MDKQFISIVESNESDNKKIEKLESFIEEAKIAIDIVKGKYKHCPKCKDYYFTKSFLTEEEIKEEEICTYEDPINSGGNEYKIGKVKYIKTLCPKGHVISTDRHELGVIK